MSLVEFKKKKDPKNKIIIGIGIVVGLLIIFSISRAIFGIGYRTSNAIPTTLYDKVSLTGLIIKSEKIYNSTASGSVEYIENEGEKVSVGKEIVNIVATNEDILAQLDEVEKQIEELGIDYYSNEEDYSLLDEIQKKISQGNYNDINEFLKDKDLNNESNNLILDNLETLLIKQKELKQLVDGSSIAIYSNDSGLVSYKIDGYEEILKPINFENYKYNALDFKEIETKMVNSKDNEVISGGKPLFKIIDDYHWHIALKFEDERILEFEEGQSYNIQFNDDEIVRGRIIAINLEDSKGVIVFEFKDKLHEYFNERVMEASLIKSQTNSLQIPTSSIVDKDGQAGVYINHIYGIVRFVPVNILEEDGDITYLDRGDSEAYISIGDEKVRTITQFDEVFINPSNLEENQILK